MARRAMGWLLILFTLALVGCDHATKAVAQTALGRRGPVAILPGLLDLHYAENRDTAFSLTRVLHFQGKGAVLAAAAVVGLCAVIFAWWRRRRASTAEQAAYALLLAGALGNALDRLRRGYVVDFIEIRHWPIFNVADIAVVAGAVLLAILAFRRSGEPKPLPPPPA
jgi:signal peptidase II